MIELPPLRALGKRAASTMLETTIIPLALFWVLLQHCGMLGAVIGGLAWSYAAIARRMIIRDRIPGMLILGAVLVTARAVVTLITKSTVVYFLQPTLGTFLIAGLFLASVGLKKPLTEKLAHDFVPLPERLLSNRVFQRFMIQVSLLWAAVFVTEGVTTLWLLFSKSVGDFIVLRTVTGNGLEFSAAAASYLWFRASLRRNGMQLRWGSAAKAA